MADKTHSVALRSDLPPGSSGRRTFLRLAALGSAAPLLAAVAAPLSPACTTARAGSPESYAALAVELGATEAKLISTKSVVTAPWVRLKCQYGCEVYGERLTCPPYAPTPDYTAGMLKDYRKALLVHGAEEETIREIVAQVEGTAFREGYYRAFGMGAGPCSLCEECTLDAKACRHPGLARPAMEACGIDVYQTVRNNGWPIATLSTPISPRNFYGLVLLE